ncbi:MAG: nucleotidyltransferase domain-containing protein, partial [Pseudomonadota bacterium]|nr:nucleotidyltransferase domain-containing protein [Pseudomonadota bacterium]
MLSKIPNNLKNDTDIVDFSEALNNKNSISDIKKSLKDLNQNLKKRFINKEPIDILVHLHSIAIDQVIICLWRKHKLDDFKEITLIAVGGYGRQELLPQSDIDIMILLGDKIQKEANEHISNFLTNLWDIGFDLGHSVRTLKECKMESKKDVITITTLMESRKLIGDNFLYDSMKDSIATDKMWPSEKYFKEKKIEQEKRHLRSDNTAYKLEPNIKISPGGLRDIQLIGWIAKRHFSV